LIRYACAAAAFFSLHAYYAVVFMLRAPLLLIRHMPLRLRRHAIIDCHTLLILRFRLLLATILFQPPPSPPPRHRHAACHRHRVLAADMLIYYFAAIAIIIALLFFAIDADAMPL